MSKETPTDAASTVAECDAVADAIIESYGGDARAAVIELVAIVRHLSEEIRMLSAASSPGFARRRPRGGNQK